MGQLIKAAPAIINDETPLESDFGFDPSTSPPPVGVDIDGKGGTLNVNPPPFPLDLNHDGDTTDNVPDDGNIAAAKGSGPCD